MRNIFGAVEKEAAIKYCSCYVYAEAESGGKRDIQKHRGSHLLESLVFFPAHCDRDKRGKALVEKSKRQAVHGEANYRTAPFFAGSIFTKRLENFWSNNIRRKDWTEDHEIYEGIMYELWQNRDLSLLKEAAALFDDSVKVKEPFYKIKTAMEELRDIEMDWAFSQKADGIRKIRWEIKAAEKS